MSTMRRTALAAVALAACIACAERPGPAGLPSDPVGHPAANAPPVRAASIPDQAATASLAFAFDASLGGQAFTDPDGDTLRYTVAFTSPPRGLTADGPLIRGTPPTPGTVGVEVTADDGRGGRAMATFAIVAFRAGLPVPRLPDTTFNYADPPLPPHFTDPAAPLGNVAARDNTSPGNPVTDAGATLGRVLFHDPRLSSSDSISCASCHRQETGFADPRRFSEGHAGGLTRRHSMGLANGRWYAPGRQFWDERAENLEAQALMPIRDTSEMALPIDDLEVKLALTPYYPPLFAAAFGSPTVTAERVALALAQFGRSMASYRSRFDSALVAGNGDPAGTFTSQELLGYHLFTSAAGDTTVDSFGCDQCHQTAAHVADRARNNGLDVATLDPGAGGGRFKVPSLRNVAVRPPYMHDGRFGTLHEVLRHYRSGVMPHPDLDPLLRQADGSPRRAPWSTREVEALVAFLETLTDRAFLTDPMFADPFVGGATGQAVTRVP
jgi:cytochrome c peroxidase